MHSLSIYLFNDACGRPKQGYKVIKYSNQPVYHSTRMPGGISKAVSHARRRFNVSLCKVFWLLSTHAMHHSHHTRLVGNILCAMQSQYGTRGDTQLVKKHDHILYGNTNTRSKITSFNSFKLLINL